MQPLTPGAAAERIKSSLKKVGYAPSYEVLNELVALMVEADREGYLRGRQTLTPNDWADIW